MKQMIGMFLAGCLLLNLAGCGVSWAGQRNPAPAASAAADVEDQEWRQQKGME